MSNSRANVRSRLAEVAQQMRLPDGDAVGTESLLHAQPHEVFASSLAALRERALSAEGWSDNELKSFEEHLALLVAGLRSGVHRSYGSSMPPDTEPCAECEDELLRCQQPDPETGLPHLDCFMVYAICLQECSRTYSHEKNQTA